MGFSGRLEGIAPSDIFQIISQSRMTGTLIARCPNGTAMIVFKEGQVIEAASDAPEESLGHILQSQSLVTEATVAAAQARWKLEPERPLGSILVEMAAIDETTLEIHVRRQIGQIVQRLMSCEDGFITFDRGEMAVKRKLHTREFFLPNGVSPEFLIMERARVADEERRRGTDRRRSPAPDAQRGAAPEGEHRRSTDIPAAVVNSAVPSGSRLPDRVRAFKFPKPSEAAVREAKQAFETVELLVGGAVLRWYRAARSKAGSFAPDGRTLVYAGIAGVAAAVCFALLFSLSRQTTGGDLLITGKVVKLRAEPTTESDVVAKISQGEIVAPVEFRDDWYRVQRTTGEMGWVWKTLVEQQEKKSAWVFSYRVLGFEILFFAGLLSLAAGILRKRRPPAGAQER